jgi:hypothetical protein
MPGRRSRSTSASTPQQIDRAPPEVLRRRTSSRCSCEILRQPGAVRDFGAELRERSDRVVGIGQVGLFQIVRTIEAEAAIRTLPAAKLDSTPEDGVADL